MENPSVRACPRLPGSASGCQDMRQAVLASFCCPCMLLAASMTVSCTYTLLDQYIHVSVSGCTPILSALVDSRVPIISPTAHATV